MVDVPEPGDARSANVYTGSKSGPEDFRIWLVIVFFIAAAIYMPALKGVAIWDDEPLISGTTPATRDLASAFTKPFGNYYRPLTSASFAVENSLVHGKPFLYHLTNIVLHALTAAFVALLAFWVTRKKLAGILAGLYFATQPLQVGAIAWIGGRTDALSAFFLSAFLVSLLRYHQTEKRPWLASALILYLLAALSKEQAAAMLPAAPLSALVFSSKGWREFWRLSAMFGAVFLLYVGLWAIGGPAPHGASNDLSTTIWLTLRTAAHYYLAFLWPNPTSLITFTLAGYQGVVWNFVGAIALIASGYLIVKGWVKCRPIAWIGVCALLVYLPISNCPTVPSFLVGPFRCAETGIAVACLLGIAMEAAITSKRLVWLGILGANLLAGAAVTCWGIQQWLTPIGFFTKVVENDPHFVIGVQKEAQLLNDMGLPGEAAHLTTGVLSWLFESPEWAWQFDKLKMAAITPEVRTRLKTNSGIPQVNDLGGLMAINAVSLAQSKKFIFAAMAAKDALVFMPNDPILNFLYGQLIRKSNRNEAIHHWEIALKYEPELAPCAAMLAHERLADHRYADAATLIEPLEKTTILTGAAWLDLADAKIGLHDWKGAKSALDSGRNAPNPISPADLEERKAQIQLPRTPAQPIRRLH